MLVDVSMSMIVGEYERGLVFFEEACSLVSLSTLAGSPRSLYDCR
jgi:hypothetical protein